jgi:hypothetical protein
MSVVVFSLKKKKQTHPTVYTKHTNATDEMLETHFEKIFSSLNNLLQPLTL